MQLTPTEEERLRVFTAAELARKILARGLKLSAPEAVALACDEMHMAARAGASYDEVVAAGFAAVGPDRVIEGVADIAAEIRVEVSMDDGSRLVVLREPFGPAADGGPGSVAFAEGDIALAPGRARIRLSVTNTSTKPVRVSSHFPFAETNAKLSFDREAARGFRLDLAAGDSLRWAPGETKEAPLVAYAGQSDA